MDGFCKACLVKYEDLSQLLQYTEKNRRLFVYSTGLQAKQSDTFPFQICQCCYLKMKNACQFKKQCRTSDKRLNNFLSLKEAGEETDFSTYLQNNDGSALFKFPINGHSTPSFQKPKDDDNVSTSTSIRNFMTDILREDEIPDTEAHIIREMIEQEADVLDDSLDSHWLQDDISIASDFRFSPFSTPHSKRTYQPLLFNYSPVKEEHQVKEEQDTCKRKLLSAKELLFNSKSCSSSQTESPRSQNGETERNGFLAAKKMLLSQSISASKVKTESLSESEDQIDQQSYIAKKRILLTSNNKEMNSQNVDMETYLATKSILNSKSDSNEDVQNFFSMTPNNIAVKPTYETLDENNLNQSSHISRKGFYVENIETNENTIQIVDVGNAGGKKDIIDKNLEKILNTTNDDDVISLSALLASPSSESVRPCNNIIATPSVHQGLSGANTPTIANILFGEKLDDNKNENIQEKDQDQANESIADKSDKANILDDFFNKETGKYIGDNQDDQKEIFEDYINLNVINSMPGKVRYDLTDFSCKKCNYRYKSERGLKIHLSKVHNLKLMRIRNKESRVDIPCDTCGKVFALRSNLTKHIKAVHINPKSAQVCTVCSIEFTTEARLNNHMRIHDGVKNVTPKDRQNKYNLMCNICGHCSTNLWNLKTHIARHNKSYSFKCDPCGAGFYRKNDLQIHMRIHMNEKPYKCNQCSESFRRKDQLQVHLKNHIGERPYTCKICEKKYATSAKLKAHMKTSRTCQNIKLQTAIKENKAIEESIEQLYVAEALVTLGNEKIQEKMEVSETQDDETTAKAVDELQDIKMEDLLENEKEKALQDDDKISLSDMFTIPIVLKD